MQCVTMEATGSTVRTTAEIARTDRRAMLRMDTVPTAANCGSRTIFAKQKYVCKMYKASCLLSMAYYKKEPYIAIKQLLFKCH